MDRRGRVAVASALLLALNLLVAVGQSGRAVAATAFNPVAGSEGFNVFVNGDAELNAPAEIEGAFAAGGDLAVGPANRAYKVPASASTAAAGQPATNATDPDPETFWQSAGPLSASTPQTLTADLGSVMTVAVVQVRLPLSLPPRTQTFSVQTSTDGTTFATAVSSAEYTFGPDRDYPHAVVIMVTPNGSGRYVRLSITANSAAPDAQIGAMQVYAYRPVANRTFDLAATPGTFNPNGEKEPTSVLIGGGINWAFNDSGTDVRVGSGHVKVGTEAGTSQSASGTTTLVPYGNDDRSVPIINPTGRQPTAVFQGGLLDFAAAFDTFRGRAAELAACPTNVALTDTDGNPLPETVPPGTVARLTLQPGVQNLLSITAANLNNISALTYASQPNATTPLVINIDTTGVGNSFAWDRPSTNLTSAAAPYILYNFPTAVRVTLNAVARTFGTVYAPRAAVAMRQTGALEGSVIADSYSHGGPTGENAGDIETALFAGLVTSCSPQVLTIAKTASVASTAPGGTVTYTITVTNNGIDPVIGATFTDSLADVVDDATVQPGATADLGTLSVVTPNLTWTGDLQIGATATITYSVVVKSAGAGNGRLVNGISSTTPGSTCPSSGAGPGCTTTVTVSGLTISKVADVASAVPSATVSYAVTVANSGHTPLTGATYTDSLADVLDDATYQADAVATVGSVNFAAPNLTWTGDLPVGDIAVITYSVVVTNPRSGNGRLVNTVSSATPGSNCPSGSADERCTATVTVPGLTIVKAVNGPTAVPGGTVEYTVSVTNSGQTPLTDGTVVDSLAGVLDDATYLGDATATSGTVSYTAPNLTWTGNLAVGSSATIGYSVIVNNPDPGDRVLTNAVTSAAPGNDCPVGNTNPACGATVTVLVPGLTIVKSGDVAETSPGGIVRYTTTVTNSGSTPYPGLLLTDDLLGVLDDATYNDDAVASDGRPVIRTGSVLSWTGDLAVAGSVTLSYSVTTTGAGDGQLVNAVTSDAAGSNCPTGGADPRCRSAISVLMPGLTVTQVADPATAAPGGTVDYTVTVANIGQLDYPALTVTESLTDIFDDATYNSDATATGGAVSVVGDALTWTGDLAPGVEVTIRFSVTATAAGDHVLRGTVVADVAGSNCPTGGPDPRCSTTVPIAQLDIDLRAVTADGTAPVTSTTPGSVVRFELTLTNLGQVPYFGILVSTDATGAYDDILSNGDQTVTSGQLILDGNQIRWTGDIPIGGTVIVTGTVTVRAAADLGDRLISANSTSTEVGSNCPPGTTAPPCGVAVPVLLPQLTLAKSASAPTAIAGDTVEYTITATNTGESDQVGVVVEDELADVLDDATYNNDAIAQVTPSGPAGTVSILGTILTWTGDLPTGARVTIIYSVTVRSTGTRTGDKILRNSAISDAPGSTCAVPQSPGCLSTVQVLTPQLTINSTADADTATPGTTVAYTLTITNSGQIPYTGTIVTVDLTGVVDDATYQNDAVATAGTVTYIAPDLTWQGDLAVGAVATVTFTATVDNPPLGDESLVLVASSAAVANNCASGSTDPACMVVLPVVSLQTLTITKTVLGGATVTAPGQVVGYVITMTNSASTPFLGATFTDFLSDVLDDASYNNDVQQTISPLATGDVVFNPADSTVTWTGTVPAQGTVTVTYSVTVLPTGAGDDVLRNGVVSGTPGTNCPSGNGDARCATTLPVVELDITFVATPPAVTPGQRVDFEATITNTGSADYRNITVSFSASDVGDDADFTGDALASSGTLSATATTLVWNGDVPVGATVTVTSSVIVRTPTAGNRAITSRAVTNAVGANCPVGSTDVACVDTALVLVPGLTIVKSSPVADTVPGARVPFTLTITNSGQTPYTGIQVRDDLSGGLDDAVFEPAVLVGGGGALTYTAPELVWSGDLAVGAVVTITYALLVNSPDLGDKNLVDVVTSEALGSTCVTGPPGAGCRVSIVVLTPELTIAKSADAAVTTMGATVQYTVTIQNSGQTPYAAAVVTDSLAGVLDDATPGAPSTDRGSVALVGSDVTWTGDLAVAETATVTYSVTVDQPDGDKVLTNEVTSAEAGANCPVGGPDPRCRTTVPVAMLTIVHTATPTQTIPTGVVVYTMAITNTGAVPYTDLVVEQNVAGVVDDATGNGAATQSRSGRTFRVAGTTLTWSGDLPAGDTVSVQQTFTVNNPTTGDLTMPAVASTTSIGSNCPQASPAPECIAVSTVQLPELTVASAVSSPTATPGDVVTVTITATNTGPVTYSSAVPSLGVTLFDSLAGTLDDATYNGDAAAVGVTGQLNPPTGGVLTWTLIGDMAPGGSVTITYSVTVNSPSTGDRVLSRRVATPALGATCPPGNTAAACATAVTVLIPELTITKRANSSSVAPDTTVRYTLTIQNTGQAEYGAGTSVTDDLSGVLDDATYLDDVATNVGNAAFATPTITWTGALAVGATALVTYSVRVDPTAGGQVLTNTVTSAAAGANCPVGGSDSRCTSTVTVLNAVLTISKTADRPIVVVGGAVQYSIVVSNDGEAPYTGVTLTDSLAGVLDAAEFEDNASATSGTVSYSEPTLTWTGDLPVDATVVITYSVRATGGGDNVLSNTVTSSAIGTTCVPSCSTSTTVAEVTITISDLTSGFVLSGQASSTSSLDGAVTLTVTTNSPSGYFVGVSAQGPALTPTTPENTDSIPVSNLHVRRTGDATFTPLADGSLVLVQIKPGPSVPGGDQLSNDYQIDIPFVRPDDYAITLDYIAMTQ